MKLKTLSRTKLVATKLKVHFVNFYFFIEPILSFFQLYEPKTNFSDK